jgi:hypothetical protein
MSNVVLSTKAAKIMTVCEAEGFATFEEMLVLLVADSLCPAICMADACNHITWLESDQEQGYCEKCGGNAMVSVLVLAGLI